MTPILYVHLGPRLAPHLLESIDQAHFVSPATPVHVVVSRNTAMAPALVQHRVELHYVEELPRIASHRTYISHVRRRAGKRKGFWRFATERFFVLEALMRKLDLETALHLESDNLVFFDLEAVGDKLRQVFPALAAPFMNDEKCIPGVFFIGSLAALEELNVYIADRVRKKDNGARRGTGHLRAFAWALRSTI